MKLICALGLVGMLVLAGCGDKSGSPAGNTNAPTASGNPLNAPADYLGGLAKGQQSAVKTVDTSSLNKAIQMFGVDQGRNPKDLAELVQKNYIPKVPEAPYGMKIVYDANAGTVSVVKQ